MRLWFALALAVVSAVPGRAQSPPPSGQPDSQPDSQIQTLTSQSALVVVPALVRDKSKGGQLVFTLTADDFQLTDDGIPQKLHLEQDTGGEPLALVVDIEGGGAGVGELAKLGSLQTMLDSVVGGVAHKIAVVGYDSSPVLVQDFTPNTEGDPGADRRQQRRLGRRDAGLAWLLDRPAAQAAHPVPPRHPADRREP